MGKIYYAFLASLFCAGLAHGQNTWDLVYSDMQSSCATSGCHASGTAIGGLDLQGSGTDPQQAVYNNIVGVAPSNSFAANNGQQRIYPGDPYRSSIFRKMCDGLDDFVQLDGAEGGIMPPAGGLDETEKELVRQWILFGAPETGNVADTALIADYYNGNGVDGVPNPITAPNAAEGYQIKLGPFFLEPQGEIEYFLKYPVENTDTVEIHKVDIDLGQLYSHHFITFRYREPGESGQPAGNPNNYAQGLRYDNAHNDVTFVTANQESATIDLPDGTGFRWLPQTVLDLNTHYINYDQNKVLKCENFVNIYTQPSGTAVQLMETDLYANTSIIIPATGQDVQFTDDIYGNSTDEVFYWMLTSHTHKLGKDFDVYTRDAQGNPDTHVFDAEYMDGDPNSAFIGYDYQHPPVRYWTYPFLPVQKNLGLQQIATYNNNTGQLVYWGDTSDDEMMITMAMFVEDTAGLGAFTNTTNLQDVASGETLQLYPNPTNGSFVVAINTMDTEEVTLSIFNAIGQQMVAKTINGQSTTEFNLAPYGAGIYSIVVQSSNKVVNRKVVVR